MIMCKYTPTDDAHNTVKPLSIKYSKFSINCIGIYRYTYTSSLQCICFLTVSATFERNYESLVLNYPCFCSAHKVVEVLFDLNFTLSLK